MKMNGLVLLCVLPIMTASARYGGAVQFHYQVVDEQGDPVPNASTVMGFDGLVDDKDAWKGQKDFDVSGKTDREGRWSVSGVTLGSPAISVKKDGYYSSGKRYECNFEKDKATGRWQPYERNETVVLRKVVNPIPMYAWSLHLSDYPVKTNEWAGFDMLRAEWMPPHGNGQTEDVRFHVWRSTNGYDRTQPSQIITVLFIGDKNGVCGIKDGDVSYQSTLKLPYKAPLDGYKNNAFRVERRLAMYEFETKTNTGTTNCFFRIRSKTDKDGNFIEGLYGKIDGPLEVVGGRGIRCIDMVYYVNPTPNDLNLEFDPNKNLIHKRGVSVAVPMP